MKRNAKNSMFFVWTLAIFACLLLVLFALIFSSCGQGAGVPVTTDPPAQSEMPADDGKESPDSGTSAEPGSESEAPDEGEAASETPASSVLLAETEDAGQEYIDKLTFLGDSTTYGLKYYEVLSGGKNTTQVWTPASGTLTLFNYATATIVFPEDGQEISIVDAVTRKLPEYLVITLGVNGVSMMDEDWFKTDYTALVQSIQAASPDTKIICNSIYPVENDYEQIESINNTNIPQANEWIKAVAEATGCKYADSASVLKAEDGSLREDYGNGDGIHLNADGFNAVLNYLRTHAYQ
uniref:GDSL-type esterase/lipase family protein n=1 Tax=Candidatus Scatomorpha intestinigallinarum TaxID=2840923 RepID=UPI0040288618